MLACDRLTSNTLGEMTYREQGFFLQEFGSNHPGGYTPTKHLTIKGHSDHIISNAYISTQGSIRLLKGTAGLQIWGESENRFSPWFLKYFLKWINFLIESCSNVSDSDGFWFSQSRTCTPGTAIHDHIICNAHISTQGSAWLNGTFWKDKFCWKNSWLFASWNLPLFFHSLHFCFTLLFRLFTYLLNIVW